MRNYQEKTNLGAMAEPGVGMDMGRAQSRGSLRGQRSDLSQARLHDWGGGRELEVARIGLIFG